MDGITEAYAKEMHHQLPIYYATWPLSPKFSLGDYGILSGDCYFNRLSNIKDNNLDFQVLKNPASQHFYFTSKSCNKAEFNVGGVVEPAGSAKVEPSFQIGFSSANGIFFYAPECEVSSIENKVKLGTEILAMHKNKQWDSDWVVITEIVKSGQTTLIISNDRDAECNLKIDAELTQLDLATASVMFEFGSSKQVALELISTPNLIPLIGLSRVVEKHFPWHRDAWGLTFAAEGAIPKAVEYADRESMPEEWEFIRIGADAETE